MRVRGGNYAVFVLTALLWCLKPHWLCSWYHEKRVKRPVYGLSLVLHRNFIYKRPSRIVFMWTRHKSTIETFANVPSCLILIRFRGSREQLSTILINMSEEQKTINFNCIQISLALFQSELFLQPQLPPAIFSLWSDATPSCFKLNNARLPNCIEIEQHCRYPAIFPRILSGSMYKTTSRAFSKIAELHLFRTGSKKFPKLK